MTTKRDVQDVLYALHDEIQAIRDAIALGAQVKLTADDVINDYLYDEFCSAGPACSACRARRLCNLWENEKGEYWDWDGMDIARLLETLGELE